MPVTPQLLSSVAGILLSLLFEYVPKLKDWYDVQPDTNQRLIMLAALLVVSLSIFGLACADYLAFIAPGLALQCTQEGFSLLVVSFISALVANQATYLISPKK